MADDGIVWLTANETLYRQVHPAQMKGSLPTSAVFKPTQQHEYTLSVTRQHVGPKGAYDQHVATGLQSSGTCENLLPPERSQAPSKGGLTSVAGTRFELV